MDKKESMEIMRTWPRMTKEDVKSADALFKHYLFFNAAGEVTASCCGKSGMVKSQALGHHREPGVCPFCGSKAIWFGKRFGKKYLAQYVPVMFIHKRNGTVYLRTCWMKRRYEDTLTPQTFYLATFSYRLRPGCAEMWENHCYYNRYHEEPKVDEYAYHLTDWMKKHYAPLKDVTGCVSYYVIGWERLKGTFLQYVGAGDRRYEDGTYYDLTKRLMLACYYPIEMLEKLGLSCFVRDLMYGTVNKEIIDYTQKDPRRALGLNGVELKELQKYNDKVLLLRLRKRLLKRGYTESIESCADYLLLCNNDINRLVRMVDKLGESPGKIRRYLEGQVNQCGHMAYGGFPSRLSAWQHYARALRNYQNDMEPAYAFYKELKDARMERAFEMIADSDTWKDAKFGLSLKVRTPERVIRKVMGDTKAAKQLYNAYFAPVIQHDAESVRWENQMRQRLKEITKGLSHEDSVYIHLRNRAGLAPDNETLQMMLEDYVEKNRDKIHFREAGEAMERMIELTNEMHPQINEAWVRNGVEPLEWHKRYLPSLTPTKEGKWYNRILRKFGIETMMDELPDDIAGRTENRRPGHQYASFANERSGVNLEFDAVKALDNYISNAAAAIFHTDDIQNLRVLEEAIRYKYSDEGSKAEMKAIGQMPQLTIEERVQRMSELWLKNAGQFPHFPSWIAEYTNLLAGKKARGDRQMESDLNRGMFRAMTDLESKVAANMTGANISTALSNIIPLTQGAGELHYSSMARAMIDYAYDLIRKNREFRDTSDFLTNRSGSERVVKTKVQRASDAASMLTRAIDHMTSEVLTRARYIDNTKRGMNQKDALKEADRWTAGLMGDRSKGARPVLFEERNPISRAFSMFQLEVMNQYDYLFGDIPSHARAQGKGKVAVAASTAGALLQIFLLAHLYNDAREKATGTRGAFDPIEIANDFVGRVTGFALPNVFTLIEEAVQGDLNADDFMVEKSDSAWENAQATMQDVASNVPFLSGPIGALFGASNARLPIESVVPDFSSIFSKTGVAQREAAIKELTKPIYGVMLPFGGTQIKKTVEGIATELAGGSYVHDNDGNLKLQFPAYGESPLEWARSAIFGKWSGEEAQKYIDSGFKGLSADETRVYNGLRDNLGVEPRKAMEAVLSLRGFKSKEDETGKTIQTVKEQQRRALFDNAELSPEQKQWIDKEMLVDPESDQEPADYSNYTNFVLSMYDSEDRREAAEEAVQHGLTVDQFVQWDDRLSEVKGTKDRFDKNQYTAAEARGIVLDEVMSDSALSDSEKQAIADYVLISSMSDTQQEKWSIAKGKVNASDFVLFKDDVAAYEDEFSKTGADNAANVATILRGYEGLTDEQRDVLYQTYSDNMSKNPFHVSVYEKNLSGNSFYVDLNDAGKAELRSLANEYEQAVEEGKELNDWQGKAYMAKEAGISPETYILYRVALAATNEDGKGSAKQSEAETAVNLLPGLTQQQKAYLYQSTNTSWKSNPFGSATVTKYNAETQEAINPVAGGTLSSSFGPRTSPTAGASSWHKAVDIAAPEGTPVQAVKSGKVTSSGWVNGYGWTVHIDHGDGTETEYHHMQGQSSLQPGDTVERGQQIGAVGSTGISTGPHLDLQAWQDGKIVDPLTIIPEYGNASGYVYDGTVSAGVVSSGKQASSGKSGSSRKSKSSTSMKGFNSFKGFKGF